MQQVFPLLKNCALCLSDYAIHAAATHFTEVLSTVAREITYQLKHHTVIAATNH